MRQHRAFTLAALNDRLWSMPLKKSALQSR
jgi:hypothetical protein